MTNFTALSGPELPPASGGNAKQLILFLHGYGANGDDLIGLAPYFAQEFPDAHFISPNAPFRCEMSGGYQWFPLQTFSPVELLSGARSAAPILNRFIDDCLKKHGLGDDRLLLVGFSQGTMMALHTALRREDACAGIIGFSGSLVGAEMLPQEIISKPPICLIHGSADMVVPYGALAYASTALTALGLSVETHTRPMLGHGIDEEGLKTAIGFAKKVLG